VSPGKRGKVTTILVKSLRPEEGCTRIDRMKNQATGVDIHVYYKIKVLIYPQAVGTFVKSDMLK
jgi:hypothetical protein